MADSEARTSRHGDRSGRKIAGGRAITLNSVADIAESTSPYRRQPDPGRSHDPDGGLLTAGNEKRGELVVLGRNGP